MGSRGPLARQTPLHRHHAPGIGAGGDDAEIGARLGECCQVDVRPLGGLFDIARTLRTTCERVLEKALGAPGAVTGLCCQ